MVPASGVDTASHTYAQMLRFISSVSGQIARLSPTRLIHHAPSIAPAIDVNVRRVLERRAGRLLTPREADAAYRRTGRGLEGRDRFLAIMDLGAMVCRAREPRCEECPLRRGCATRGPLAGEVRTRQAPFEGSFRQRRGRVMARLRSADAVPAGELDEDALASLVADGLAVVRRGRASLP